MSAFYQKVSALPGVTVYGDFAHERAPIVTLNIGDMDSGEAAEILSDDYGIAVRSGALLFSVFSGISKEFSGAASIPS